MFEGLSVCVGISRARWRGSLYYVLCFYDLFCFALLWIAIAIAIATIAIAIAIITCNTHDNTADERTKERVGG